MLLIHRHCWIPSYTVFYAWKIRIMKKNHKECIDFIGIIVIPTGEMKGKMGCVRVWDIFFLVEDKPYWRRSSGMILLTHDAWRLSSEKHHYRFSSLLFSHIPVSFFALGSIIRRILDWIIFKPAILFFIWSHSRWHTLISKTVHEIE